METNPDIRDAAPSADGSPLMDAAEMDRALDEMADALAGMVEDPARTALAGIRTRGVVIAARLRDRLRASRGWELPLGALDITLYRDDLSGRAEAPEVRETSMDFDVEGTTILLVDDVLFTGRTIRAAIEEIMDFGRPRAVRLATLVDRGGRELPIRADFAPLRREIPAEDAVRVLLRESDGVDEVRVEPRTATERAH